MHRMFPHAVIAACFACLQATPCRGADSPSPAGPPLTLGIAVERALARHPDLQVFGFRLRAQAARREEAGLSPTLHVQTDLENVLGTGRVQGVDAFEATFRLSGVLELGEKRDRRVAAVERGAELIEVERAAAQLDVVAEVTRRFIHVTSDQAQLDYTRRATGLAVETVASTETRLQAGRAPEVEVRRARVALARARLDEEHAEHELLASRRQLAASWGDRELGFGLLEADLYALPDVVDFEVLLARLDANPDALRFASEARLRDAERRLAESRQRVDLTYSAGVRRLQDTQDQAFVFGVSVPLGVQARARHAIDEARALEGETATRRAAHRVQVEAQLYALYQELRHAVTEAEVLRAELVPEMEAALAATRYAFDRGRYGYVELVESQHELIDVQRALVEASTNAHLYLAEIERLTGESLTPTGNQP